MKDVVRILEHSCFQTNSLIESVSRSSAETVYGGSIPSMAAERALWGNRDNVTGWIPHWSGPLINCTFIAEAFTALIGDGNRCRGGAIMVIQNFT